MTHCCLSALPLHHFPCFPSVSNMTAIHVRGQKVCQLLFYGHCQGNWIGRKGCQHCGANTFPWYSFLLLKATLVFITSLPFVLSCLLVNRQNSGYPPFKKAFCGLSSSLHLSFSPSVSLAKCTLDFTLSPTSLRDSAVQSAGLPPLASKCVDKNHPAGM